MKVVFKKYLAVGFLALFLGATMVSCSAKKKCHPPCPTWSKKKKH